MQKWKELALLVFLSGAQVATAACDISITQSGAADLIGRYAVPILCDPYYGLRADFTISGTPSAPFKVRFRVGSQIAEWTEVSLGPGNHWWWGPFNSSLDGEVPYEIWIDPDGVSGDTNPSNNRVVGTFKPSYPRKPLERIGAFQVDVWDRGRISFAPSTGTVGKVELLFGEPMPSTSISSITNYSPPAGSSYIVTNPNGIPVRRLQWLNLNTAVQSVVSGERTFTATTNATRVNRDLLEAIPWSAIDAPVPADVQVFGRSEVTCPTGSPEVDALVQASLPSTYRSTLTPYAASRALFLGVVKRLQYNNSFPFNPIDAYNRGSGACGDYSYLFVASMRRIGFSARVVAGWRMGESVWHIWSEFYMPGVGWVPADATDSDSIDPGGNYAYHFGNVPDLSQRVHVSFGGDVEWPGIPGFVVGNLQVPNWYWNGGATFQSYSAETTLFPRESVSLIADRSTVHGGSSATFYLYVKDPPTVNQTYALTSSNPTVAVVSATATIHAGSTRSAVVIDSKFVPVDSAVSIQATGPAGTAASQLTVLKPQPNLVFLSRSVLTGDTARARITLPFQAPLGGQTVTLTTQGPLSAPASVVVPAGSSALDFNVSVGSSQVVYCASLDASSNGSTATDSIIVIPSVMNVTLNTPSVVGGVVTTGTVHFDVATTGQRLVRMTDDTVHVLMSTYCVVPPSQTVGTFSIWTYGVSSSTLAKITATYGGLVKTVNLTLTPATLDSLWLTPTAVIGGSPSMGNVRLIGKAPAGGAVVALSSSIPSAANHAPSVTISHGASIRQFPISTFGVDATKNAVITAIYAGVTRTAVISVRPATLASLSLVPSTVKGGNPVTATVSMTGKTGPLGRTILLSSNHPKIVVPSSMYVPPQQFAWNLTVVTQAVTSTTVGTITATQGATTRTGTLTLTP